MLPCQVGGLGSCEGEGARGHREAELRGHVCERPEHDPRGV